ncbi:MAG: 6-carboxytetrahydropterin synthase [Desulfurococcales archaeon]|nr:6-carboxytetrahydropterin synthase [Desulfurococcales archaeon]
MLEYCVEGLVSIALRIKEWGYPVHGHDVRVEACFSSRKPVDVTTLSKILGEALSGFDHRPLWEVLPGKSGRDPVIEDLLMHLCRELPRRLEESGVGDVEILGVKAVIPGATIRLPCVSTPV